MAAFARILGWAFKIGGIAFAIGFVGPMLVRPDANQGPLLGILVTGPLGFVAGLVVGAVMEWRRPPPAARAPDGRVPRWFRR